MKPLKRKGVPLPMFGIRHKKLIRRKAKPLQMIRPAKEKPNSNRVYPIERKEEKHSPQETKDIALSINKLRDVIVTLNTTELKRIAATDSRITARKMAEEELKRRAG